MSSPHLLHIPMSIQKVLQWLVQNQLSPVLVLAAPPSIVESICEELAQVVTQNADNLSAAWRPVSVVENPTIFVTQAEVEALVKREKEGFVRNYLSQP